LESIGQLLLVDQLPWIWLRRGRTIRLRKTSPCWVLQWTASRVTHSNDVMAYQRFKLTSF